MARRLRAAFFDVGGTLLASRISDPWRPIVLKRLDQEFNSPPWAEELYAADIRRPDPNDPYRQETVRWLGRWFRDAGVHLGAADVERVRAAFAAPLPADFHLTSGADAALRWCKAKGLTVILVTNTLSTGDKELRGDWDRLGFAGIIDHVVSSYSTGWRKPHPKIFERALTLAGVSAVEACMTGDELVADIKGAKELGMRAVLLSATQRVRSERAGPDAIIPSLTDLPVVLDPWLGR